MADPKIPKKPHVEPGMATEHSGRQAAFRGEAEKTSRSIFEEIAKLNVEDLETLHKQIPFFLHEAKNRLARSSAEKSARSPTTVFGVTINPELEHSRQEVLSFRDRCWAIFELMGGPRSWRYQGLPIEKIVYGKLPLPQTSDPVKTTETDTAKEGKKVREKPETTTDDDWKPALSVRTWHWMEGIFAGLCLIILAIDLFLGPSKVPIILVCIGLAGMLFLTVHAIYEWWHWVST